jgi:hypothetical protein
MQFRDAAKGWDLSEFQMAANWQLELEIGDIRGYVKGQVADLSLADQRSYRQPERLPQKEKRALRPEEVGHGFER